MTFYTYNHNIYCIVPILQRPYWYVNSQWRVSIWDKHEILEMPSIFVQLETTDTLLQLGMELLLCL